MKRFLIITSFLFLPYFANCAEMPVNINEYINKPYIGMEYYQALEQDLPFLLIFANPNNIIALSKLLPIGQMVYDEFKGKYNFKGLIYVFNHLKANLQLKLYLKY